MKKRNIKKSSELTAFERMNNIIVKEFNQAEEFYQQLIKGHPLLLNFDNLSQEDANNMIAFLSGVIRVFNGQVHKIGQRTFLFAKEEDFKDGTLDSYILERLG